MAERFPSLSDVLEREATKLKDQVSAQKLLLEVANVARQADKGDQHALFHLGRMIRTLCQDRATRRTP